MIIIITYNGISDEMHKAYETMLELLNLTKFVLALDIIAIINFFQHVSSSLIYDLIDFILD